MANKHVRLELLKPDKLIKENTLQEITNPTYFIRDGIPTPDGLLSNDIFGISKNDRSNIFAYIQLNEWYLHPLIYLLWSRMDKNINSIIYEQEKFIVNDDGDLIQDEENGETGIEFLKKNVNKIKIKSTGSKRRDESIKFIEKNINNLFIKQCIVIPAYYRDVDTTKDGVGVGDVNKLYNSLILSIKTVDDLSGYGSSISGSIKGRIQNTILELYNWFISGPVIEGTNKRTGNNITSKYGIIRRAVMSKTTTYGSRLVISGTDNNVETIEDYDVDVDTCGLGLSSSLVNFYPYIIFYLRRFFDNEFSANKGYPVMKKDGSVEYMKVKDPDLQFSDDVLKKQINRFIKGFSNRFIPVTVELENGKTINMRFKGNSVSPEDINKDYKTSPLIERDLTWCDLFYIAAVESSKDKYVQLTRYPLDSHFGQFPNKIFILSTIETEPIYIDNTLYKKYPKIRQEDIGKNTSSKFYNGLQVCELNFEITGADTDGDQFNIKPIFSIEANDELEKFINSKAYYIGASGYNIRVIRNEAIQAMYSMTKHVKDNKVTPSKNITFS